MLGSSEIIAFVATSAPERAREFYRDTLGLRLVSEDPFALVFDAHGTMLRISIVKGLKPAEYTILGWQVGDIAAAVKDLKKAGVKFQYYEGLTQDSLEIWTSPSGAKVAWFKDPDGNVLSITQFP